MGGYSLNVMQDYMYRVWQHSPRLGRIIILKSLPYTKDKRSVQNWRHVGRSVQTFVIMPVTSGTPQTYPATKPAYDAGMPALESESYAKLRGKLYKGSASLGVTAGSYQETRAMVVNNYNLWNDKSQTALHRARLNRRNVLFTSSDDYLEYIFGVKPLYEDIRKSVQELCQYASPPEFISARTSSVTPISVKIYDNGTERKWFSGNLILRCNRSTQVKLDQPNLWLAERAGALNISAVAWDLVPWSFLLNMFVNLNQLVQSITDFVGLSFPNGSMTKRAVYAGVESVYGGYVPFGVDKPYFAGSATLRADSQVRTTSAVARPPLVMRLPGVNWETAAMAASLCTQQVNRIPVVKAWRNFR